MFHTSFVKQEQPKTSSSSSSSTPTTRYVLTLQKADVDSASKSKRFSDEHFHLTFVFNAKDVPTIYNTTESNKIKNNKIKNKKSNEIKSKNKEEYYK
jgi:hypothetical protein